MFTVFSLVESDCTWCFVKVSSEQLRLELLTHSMDMDVSSQTKLNQHLTCDYQTLNGPGLESRGFQESESNCKLKHCHGKKERFTLKRFVFMCEWV